MQFDSKELEEFVYLYNTVKMFREDIQEKYKTNKTILSELEIYALEHIIKYQPYKSEILTDDYTSDYIEYDFDTEEGILKAAAEMYAASVVRSKFNYPDNLVPYKDVEKVSSFLKSYFYGNKERVLRRIESNLGIIKYYLDRGEYRELRIYAWDYKTNISIIDLIGGKNKDVYQANDLFTNSTIEDVRPIQKTISMKSGVNKCLELIKGIIK